VKKKTKKTKKKKKKKHMKRQRENANPSAKSNGQGTTQPEKRIVEP
jgi:hypothetical protein